MPLYTDPACTMPVHTTPVPLSQVVRGARNVTSFVEFDDLQSAIAVHTALQVGWVGGEGGTGHAQHCSGERRGSTSMYCKLPNRR